MHSILHPFSVPAGYPRELAREVVLDDGTRAQMRPIVPEDAPVLAEEILTADSETLYLRFFTSKVRPDPAMLAKLTVMDYQSALAIGMIESDTGVSLGIARYAEIDNETVEVAVSVKTGWRRRGIAALLLDVIERAAAERGYRRALALYLIENGPAGRLFEQRDYHIEATDRGVVEAVRDLTTVGSAA